MYNLKKLYPVLEKYTYLDTAAHGLVSTQLVQHKAALQQQLLHNASGITNDSAQHLQEVRETLAHFIDAPVASTGLVPNFSLAFNRLLGILPKTSTFLLLSGDYPSINHAVESHGFSCFYTRMGDRLEENIDKACEQYQPDYLALSIVQYISGIKIDLAFLRTLKTKYPNMIIIADATQFVGVSKFRFRESGIDIIAASCYKWLNAGDGVGFIAFKDKAVNQIKPKNLHYDPMQSFDNARGTFMGLFEPGHLDVIAFKGLEFAIHFVHKYGLENIEQQIGEIAQEAKEALSQRGLLDEFVKSRAVHSSIFNIPGNRDLFDTLTQQGIATSQRGDGIRISFSYYNTGEDLNKFLKVLDSY